MTSKERVKRAIAFQSPDKVPLYLFNKDIEQSDIISLPLGRAADFKPSSPLMTEFGYEWESVDDTMGQPKEFVIKEWEDFETYRFPNPNDPARYAHLSALIERYHDKYLMLGIGISGFNNVTFIRGFENTLIDLYTDREQLTKLIDGMFEYECGLIDQLKNFPEIDAFAFYDDWGSQKSLLINPVDFREIFLPHYKRQFSKLKSMGKHIYYHSCGYVLDIIPDLIEAGVDVFNFNQPSVSGIDSLSRFNGEVCFNCPVDLQSVALKGSRKEIFDYTEELFLKLGKKNGGYIGYVEEYHSIGLSEENYRSCVEAVDYLNKKYYKTIL